MLIDRLEHLDVQNYAAAGQRREGGQRGARLLDGKHIHAIDLEAGAVVATRVERGRLGAAPLSGAHAVVIIFADEQCGQVPQRRDVQRLE